MITRPELFWRLRHIKMLALDFDGVFTDGFLYIDNYGNEFSRCSHVDGLGISLLKKNCPGIDIVVITNQTSDYPMHRCKKMGIPCKKVWGNKLVALTSHLQSFPNKEIKLEEVCFVGDDMNDLEVLENVGLSVAPSSAEEEVKKRVNFVTRRGGGNGAIREICDLIVGARKEEIK